MPQPQPQIKTLAPYQPGMPIEELARRFDLRPQHIIKLASNENPYGMSPIVRQALIDATADTSRYPDAHVLYETLAAFYEVPRTMITLGNGSNDILDIIARVYLGQGTNAVVSQYAFGIYSLVTRATGATCVTAPAVEFGHDLEAMLAAITPQTRVVWIANPNNPTGTFIPYSQVKDFLSRVPKKVVVVLDEAYYEYLAPEERADTVAWLAEYPNLILVRTFSKIYGLAALRVGYALASDQITALLNRIRQPFNVNGPAIVAATTAINDQAFAYASREQNRSGLAHIEHTLDGSHLAYVPSRGNFVMVAFVDAVAVYQELLRQGIIVRPLTEYGLPDYLRISVGTLLENERLCLALRNLPS